ncbi:lantibiotic dehydratase [Bacillus subtilis]|nr:lantibiotic dehydratase [Bacillus subtilis]MDM5302505.1 lantibiotic dehydratase [Bacillus subtilis]MDM5324558.1 lantibiotic dehydratase [Bacillus subtilis]
MLFPWYVIRKNTVAYEEFRTFRDTDLTQKMKGYLDRYHSFEENKQKIINSLERKFGDYKDKQILNYKRKIFNNKIININGAPQSIIEELSEYVSIYQDIEFLRRECEENFLYIENKHRREIWELAHKKSELTNPLPLVNYKMYTKLEKYLSTDPTSHKAKVKKMDSTLLRIISRAALKTSPFSSFTSVELKKISASKTNNEPIKCNYFAEINYYILQKLIQLISTDEDFMPNLKFLYSGSVYEDKGIVEFTIRQDLNRGKIFNNLESHFTAKNNQIFDQLAQYNGPISYEEIIELLSVYTNRKKADSFFRDGLLKKGIIYPDIELDEYADDILGDFYQKLKDLKVKSSKKDVVLRAVETISCYLDDYKNADFKERFKIYSDIINVLHHVENIFQHEFTKGNIFYEDYVVNNSDESLDIDADFLNDLSYIQKLAIITNIPLQFRYEFAYQYKKRYQDRLMPVGKREIRDLYMEEVRKFTNWTNVLAPVEGLVSEGGKLLEKIKTELRTYFKDLNKHQNITQVSKEVIDQLYKNFRDSLCFNKDNLSSTVLFQKADDRYILNKLYAGNLKLFTRYFQFDPSIYDDQDFKEYVAAAYPEMDEIREGFGFNANYHRRYINNRLMIPYSKTNSSDLSRYDSHDLYYQYNKKTQMIDIVHKDRPDKALNIDYIGSLVDYMMPPSIRMLTTTIAPRFDAGLIRLWDDVDNGDSLVLDHIPRMTIGKTTLLREKWLVNAEQLLSIQEHNTFDNYLATLAEFLKHDLPLEFFVGRIIDTDSFDFVNANRSEMKPQYINLYSPLFYKELKKIINNEKCFVIEEFYPKESNRSFNTEYQLEVNLINEST